ncbi:uncharacterized protein LOC142336939 [Convolutriloba macropyga]|uniref:uncharacterized protein LOC142336939 n=1 Tax=Convolutriloba macropyga TaxID=536237 RepID=UPI003F51C5A6
MRKATEPICYEHGNGRAVSDDSIPNICRINGKRLDGTWGPWKYWKTTKSSDDFEWRKEEKRECITPSHGGLWCYGESTQTTEWIVLSHHGRTFDDAKEHCLLQNGILIENQDSELLTKIAKIFVEDRSDFRDFWVGYKYDKQQITRLSDGIILPYTTLSIWDTGEPSGYNNEFYVKILVKRDDNDQIYVRFHNHVDAIFAFVCDKTPRS